MKKKKKLKILIVDDEPVLASFIDELKNLGHEIGYSYSIRAFRNCISAEKEIEKNDVFLVDLYLPRERVEEEKKIENGQNLSHLIKEKLGNTCLVIQWSEAAKESNVPEGVVFYNNKYEDRDPLDIHNIIVRWLNGEPLSPTGKLRLSFHKTIGKIYDIFYEIINDFFGCYLLIPILDEVSRNSLDNYKKKVEQLLSDVEQKDGERFKKIKDLSSEILVMFNLPILELKANVSKIFEGLKEIAAESNEIFAELEGKTEQE